MVAENQWQSSYSGTKVQKKESEKEFSANVKPTSSASSCAFTLSI